MARHGAGIRWLQRFWILLLLPHLLGSDRTTSSLARMSPYLRKSVMNRPLRRTLSKYLHRGHSHNDYHQSYPLSSALGHGIKSIEVDVFPRNSALWVGHTIFELDPSRTIESMYIRPILSLFRRSHRETVLTANPGTNTLQEGSFTKKRSILLNQEEPDALTLLVDFKANPEKSVALLHEAIAPLRPYLTRIDKDGNVHQGRLTVLVSGNRPKPASLVTNSGDRFIFIDGRVKDIHGETDTTLVPLVSLPWRRLQLAKMVGRGDEYMRNMAEEAHKQGKQLRIWGAPNQENAWSQMLRNNVDLLSVDDHSKFARFAAEAGAEGLLRRG